MTMYDGRTNLSRQVVEEVSAYFPAQLYNTVIPRSIRIGEAPSHGKTIFEHDPSGNASIAYGNAADEFLTRHKVFAPPAASVPAATTVPAATHNDNATHTDTTTHTDNATL